MHVRWIVFDYITFAASDSAASFLASKTSLTHTPSATVSRMSETVHRVSMIVVVVVVDVCLCV